MNSTYKIKEGLASILVPTYNGGKYVQEFLDSLKEQTYRPLEIIIRDDCSTDNTYDICMRWKLENSMDDFLIECYRAETNGGLSENISNLSTHAHGEYIFIADQDDVWLREKVSRQIEYLKEHSNCVISICDRKLANENLKIIEESEFGFNGYKIEVFELKDLIKRKGAGAANAMAIRNKGYNIFDIPSKVVSHDFFIGMMASTYGTVNFMFEPLLVYRIHLDNLSGNFSSEFSKNFIQSLLMNYKKTKRIKAALKYDCPIISSELMRRFQINTDDYDVDFKKSTNINRLKFAWNTTIKQYKNGKIGKWRNL